MKHGLNILFCLFSMSFIAACDSSDPCPGGWMTFFVDEQAVLSGAISGHVCDGNEGCEGQSSSMVPGFWGACLSSPSLCGAPNHWVCMQPGEHSYELKALNAEADPASKAGTFNFPAVEGANCRMRAYVNSNSPHLQTLTCGAGRFYGPDASFGPVENDEGTVRDSGETEVDATSDEGVRAEVISLDGDNLDPCGVGSICQPTWLGDGSCDAACNCEATGFDDRDCDPSEAP
jgi:hypothetical protein